MSQAPCPTRDGTCEIGVVSTRPSCSEPNLAHVGDPSSADPAHRGPRCRGRHHCREETEFQARRLDAANARFRKAGSVDQEDRPSPKMPKGSRTVHAPRSAVLNTVLLILSYRTRYTLTLGVNSFRTRCPGPLHVGQASQCERERRGGARAGGGRPGRISGARPTCPGSGPRRRPRAGRPGPGRRARRG